MKTIAESKRSTRNSLVKKMPTRKGKSGKVALNRKPLQQYAKNFTGVVKLHKVKHNYVKK